MQQFFELSVIALIVVAMVFLPALIEIKKPKDNGPRKIVGFETGVFLHTRKEPEPIAQTLSGNMPFVTFDFLTNLEV